MPRPRAVNARRARVVRPSPTHYDVLGLRPSARATQIRAAYVERLKLCHPDSSSRNPHRDRFDLDRVVAAYKTLKDEELRRAYDAQLRSAFPLTPIGSLPLAIPRRRQRDSGNSGSSSGAAALAVLGVGALAVALIGGLHPRATGADYQAAGIATQTEREDMPRLSQLETTAKLAATMPVSGAVAFSSQCFDRARGSRSPSAADLCIAFDTAFTYWQQGVGGRYLAEPYYQPQAQNLRFGNALSSLTPDAAMVRAASIRASTFEALLRIVGSNDDLSSLDTANSDGGGLVSAERRDEISLERDWPGDLALSQNGTTGR